MATSKDVLIVGAGPTGLLLACELARRNVSFRLIDKKQGPSRTSRSFTIHARTLEIFEQIGVAERFLKQGIQNKGFLFNFQGQKLQPKLDFSGLKSSHPFILICSQNETERNLINFLHETYSINPEWGTTVIDMRPNAEGNYLVTLEHSDKRPEEIVLPSWIIGCDGCRSKVRNAAALEFPGGGYDGMVMQMMDVPCNGFDKGDDWIHYYMSKDSFLLINKLPGNNYRVLTSMMRETAEDDLSPRDAFQKVVDTHVENVTLGEPEWVTKWQIWKRLASSYSKGNVILAGDAAHVHSPSGGQGMNCGMQDSFNLAWKLALIQKGLAKSDLIETYEPERKPIGEQIIAGTDAMHNVIMAHGKGMKDRLELTQSPHWHDESINRIAGLSYHYRLATVPATDAEQPCSLSVGDRAPDVSLSDGRRLLNILRHTKFTLILVPGIPPNSDEIMNIKSEVQSVFSHLVEVIELDKKDVEGPFADIYGRTDCDFVYLIRPDGYIGFRGPTSNDSELLQVLETKFHLISKKKEK